MTLPFEKDNGLRKYACFVCGRQYEDFVEFNKHIEESHEEGREYVKCPLTRCQACVRDIRMHFKAKHPNESIPKIGQMRAMIWKDQNIKKGGVKARKPKFREGYLLSNKNGKEMHYRSGKECELYECLEQMPEVIKYDVEPFPVKYFKPDTGEVHEYFPDLSVVFDDGHIEIWEVKPANQTHLKINNAKWTACQQHCEQRGWDFVVVTEVGIEKLKKRIRGYNANS
jgi:hypothetical protein